MNDKSASWLKIALIGGTLYFLAIAMVHMIGLKVPGLYIYFNTPSFLYQDRIIGLLVFGWACFFWMISQQLHLARYVLLPLFVALGVLALINVSTDFEGAARDVGTWPYWLEWCGLCIYGIILLLLVRRYKKAHTSAKS